MPRGKKKKKQPQEDDDGDNFSAADLSAGFESFMYMAATFFQAV